MHTNSDQFFSHFTNSDSFRTLNSACKFLTTDLFIQEKTFRNDISSKEISSSSSDNTLTGSQRKKIKKLRLRKELNILKQNATPMVRTQSQVFTEDAVKQESSVTHFFPVQQVEGVEKKYIVVRGLVTKNVTAQNIESFLTQSSGDDNLETQVEVYVSNRHSSTQWLATDIDSSSDTTCDSGDEDDGNYFMFIELDCNAMMLIFFV